VGHRMSPNEVLDGQTGELSLYVLKCAYTQ
jgi:hypothetical protein